jgi:hypothetical protein
MRTSPLVEMVATWAISEPAVMVLVWEVGLVGLVSLEADALKAARRRDQDEVAVVDRR